MEAIPLVYCAVSMRREEAVLESRVAIGLAVAVTWVGSIGLSRGIYALGPAHLAFDYLQPPIPHVLALFGTGLVLLLKWLVTDANRLQLFLSSYLGLWIGGLTLVLLGVGATQPVIFVNPF